MWSKVLNTSHKIIDGVCIYLLLDFTYVYISHTAFDVRFVYKNVLKPTRYNKWDKFWMRNVQRKNSLKTDGGEFLDFSKKSTRYKFSNECIRHTTKNKYNDVWKLKRITDFSDEWNGNYYLLNTSEEVFHMTLSVLKKRYKTRGMITSWRTQATKCFSDTL